MSPRDTFIRAVAEYLVSDLGRKSIELQMSKPDAIKWAKAYQAANCRGYATSDEAEEAIRRTLEQTETAVAK